VWLSPASIESYEFLAKFQSIKDKLGDSIIIKPKYKFRNMKNKLPNPFLRQYCYSEGRFCAIEQDYFEPHSLLQEGLRQICIFDLSERQNNKNQLWWDYILNYSQCLKKQAKDRGFRNLDCYARVFDAISIEADVKLGVEKCVEESWSISDDKYMAKNDLLESHENPDEYSSLYLVPAIFVNNNMVKEDLNPKVVVSAVCNVLSEKPAYCTTYLTDNISWTYNQKSSNNQQIVIIVSIVAVSVIAMIIVLFLIRKSMNQHIQSEISDEIRHHVTEYMKLRDSMSVS
jgi:hypothetical protein